MNIYIFKILELSGYTKYSNWYASIINRALHRNTTGYTEKHHIVPKSICMEYRNDKNNVVSLYPKEHFIVHLLLTKMLSGKNKSKMIYAFNGFIGSSNKHQSNRFVSRLYDKHKKHLIDIGYQFKRMYFCDYVRYVNIHDPETFAILESHGWQYTMTEEYKVGRVGNNKGCKQTQHQKDIVSKMRRKDVKLKTLYFLDISARIDIRSNDIDEYIAQGWSFRITPEYKSLLAKNMNLNMSKDARREAGKNISYAIAKYPVLACPHCGKLSKSPSNMSRWHFDNCKLKT